MLALPWRLFEPEDLEIKQSRLKINELENDPGGLAQ